MVACLADRFGPFIHQVVNCYNMAKKRLENLLEIVDKRHEDVGGGSSSSSSQTA